MEQLIRYSLRASPETEHVVVSLKNLRTELWIRLENMGVRVVTCNFNSSLSVIGGWRLRLLLQSLASSRTIIQCWMYHANLVTSIFGFGLGINVVWSIRRTQTPPGLTGVISKFSAVISHVVHPHIISNSESGILSHRRAGYYLENSHVIQNGFFNEPVRQNAIKSNFENSSEITFGIIGRYAPVKGHRYMLEAVIRLNDSLPPEQFSKLKFIFAGRGIVESECLKKYMQDEVVKKSCRFLGEVSDISSVLRRIDCLILPSLSEGFPNVLVEAMIAYKYCIVTDVGDVRRIVNGKITPVRPGSAHEIEQAILDCIGLPSSVRHKKIRELGNDARKMFSIRSCWEKYKSLYDSILIR